MSGFNIDVDPRDTSAWAVVDTDADMSLYKMHRRRGSDDRGARVSAQYNESPTVTAMIQQVVSVVPQYTSHADFRRDWDIKGLQIINQLMKQGQLAAIPGFQEALDMVLYQQQLDDIEAMREQANIIASKCESLFNSFIESKLYGKAAEQLSKFNDMCALWEDLPETHDHYRRLFRMRDKWEQYAHLVDL